MTKRLMEFAFRANDASAKPFILDFLKKIDYKSAYWDKDAYLLMPALELLNDSKYEMEFIDKLINENPDKEIAQRVLYEAVSYSYYANKIDNGKMFYQMLTAKYPKSKYAKMAMQEFSPDKKMAAGKQLPSFSLVNVDKTNAKIDNNSIRGKYYLVDVWATWCGPCVGEMEFLQNANKKFSGKKFGMLSISIDEKIEDIGKFRKAKWKMPWLHAFSQGVWKSEIVNTFEVASVPYPILIDPSGKILEMGSSLRGEQLEKTLLKYLK